MNVGITEQSRGAAQPRLIFCRHAAPTNTRDCVAFLCETDGLSWKGLASELLSSKNKIKRPQKHFKQYFFLFETVKNLLLCLLFRSSYEFRQHIWDLNNEETAHSKRTDRKENQKWKIIREECMSFNKKERMQRMLLFFKITFPSVSLSLSVALFHMSSSTHSLVETHFKLTSQSILSLGISLWEPTPPQNIYIAKNGLDSKGRPRQYKKKWEEDQRKFLEVELEWNLFLSVSGWKCHFTSIWWIQTQ